MDWKDKTCEKCVFRVGTECRRFPPSPDASYSYPAYTNVAIYPHRSNPWFSNACAEYAELLSKEVTA